MEGESPSLQVICLFETDDECVIVVSGSKLTWIDHDTWSSMPMRENLEHARIERS